MVQRREPHFGAGGPPQASPRKPATQDRPARPSAKPASAPRPRRGVNLVVVLAAVTAIAGSGYYALEQKRMRTELAAQLEAERQASRGMALESERRVAEATKQAARLAQLEEETAQGKQAAERAAKLASQLKAVEDARRQAEDQAKSVEQRLSQREKADARERDGLRESLEAAEAKVLRLTTEVEDLRSARETADAARAAAEKEAGDLMARLKGRDTDTGQIEALRAELAEAQRAAEGKAAEIASLKARLQGQSATVAAPVPGKPVASSAKPATSPAGTEAAPGRTAEKKPAAAPVPAAPRAAAEGSLAEIFKAVEEVRKEAGAGPKAGAVAPARGAAVAPAYADPPLHLCDRLAADPNDPSRKTAGVVFERLPAEEAIAACAPAVSSFPDSARLQYQLGRAFEKAAQYGEALARYRNAADHGYGAAQNALGRLYETGHGVRSDAVEAFLWYSLAARGGNPEARRSLAAMQLTAAQRATAERRVAEWRPRQ